MPVSGTGIRQRCQIPGAIRLTRGSLRRGTGGPPSGFRCDCPARRSGPPIGASYGLLRRLEFADQQLVALDLGFKAVERARRRTGHDLSIDRKQGGVARAQELVFVIFPVIGAPEMRTLRTESD